MLIDRRRVLQSSAAVAAMVSAGSAPTPGFAAEGGDLFRIRRRYVKVGAQNLFYLHAGSGPPVVLIHSSPGDSAFFLREFPTLAKDYSVFAFDTPGFGRSDALPMAQRDVSFLADTIAAAMRQLNLPPALIFGSHTGAAIAAELAARQRDVVQAVMLDGFPIFNEEELDTWFADFFPPLVPDKQGGHFSSVWTRCRDQGVWFPWSFKQPDHMLRQGIAPVGRIESTAMSVMRCGRTYVPAFRSAVFYGPRVPATLARIDRPTMITCAKGDPLSAHLDRLPALKPNQTVSKQPTGEAVRALRDEWFKRHASTKVAPPLGNSAPTGAGIMPHIVELADGREVFMRVAGDPGHPALFLLHDAPGSSQRHEALIAALSVRARVYAIDIPGCGESEPLSVQEPALGDYAQCLSQVMDALGVEQGVVYGIGFGGSLALEMALRFAGRVRHLVVQSVLLPSPRERVEMQQKYAPPIALRADGTHWYNTWLMLRDSLAFWPWYQSTSGQALRKTDMRADFDADYLHDWTVEVMKQSQSYHKIIAAALAHDAQPALQKLGDKMVVCSSSRHPFAAYEGAVMAMTSGAHHLDLSHENQDAIEKLLGFVEI